MVLNLYMSDMQSCQISCISDTYITIHNSSTVVMMKKQWNKFIVKV